MNQTSISSNEINANFGGNGKVSDKLLYPTAAILNSLKFMGPSGNVHFLTSQRIPRSTKFTGEVAGYAIKYLISCLNDLPASSYISPCQTLIGRAREIATRV